MRKFYPEIRTKGLLFFIALVTCFTVNAQRTPVSADPALGSFDITNLAGTSVDANNLSLGSAYLLKLSVFNLNTDFAPNNFIPPNSALVDIGLGSKMTLDPTYNLNTAPLNNYFTFQYVTVAGEQPKIRCNINTNIPRDFFGEFSFKVIAGPPQGSSTITGNFFLPNNNPNFILSDIVGGNNTAGLSYFVGPSAGPLPVNITNLNAKNFECNVDVNWNVSQEINVANYEVELSKDGVRFANGASVMAANKNNYNVTIPLTEQLKSPLLFIRLKSIDNDGTFKYSSIVTVKGNCTNNPKQTITCYPNPVTNQNFITIASKGANFEGNYSISIIDATGKLYSLQKMNLSSLSSFKLPLNNAMAKGEYFIRLQHSDEALSTTLIFIKK